MNSQTAKGRLGRMWVDDIKNWMSLDSYKKNLKYCAKQT